MAPLLKAKVKKEIDGKLIKIGFTKYGNQHLYSDTFKRAKELKKDGRFN